MSDKSNYRFLDDQEKRIMYSKAEGLDITAFSCHTKLKVYTGAEILLYCYGPHKELILITVLVCTGFTFTQQGMSMTFMDRKTFRTLELNEAPTLLPRENLCVQVPYHCRVERTVKRAGNGALLTSMTAEALFMSRSSSRLKVPYHGQAIHFTAARKVLGAAEFDAAIEKLEETYHD